MSTVMIGRLKRPFSQVMIGVGLLFLVFSVNVGPAHADTPRKPYSYKKLVGGDKYIFVMKPENFEKYPGAGNVEAYPYSGLYLNNWEREKEPLWIVGWYAFKVYVSSDGNFAARMGPWPKLKDNEFGEKVPDTEVLAVAFYERGRLLRQYLVRDLVKDPGNLPCTISHYFWVKNKKFNEDMDSLLIETYEDQRFVFDMRSGDVMSRPD